MDINIEDFDITFLIPNKKCLVIGDKKSGKSTLLKDIIRNINICNGTVITNKDHINNFYNFLDPKILYRRFSRLHVNRYFINNSYIIIDDYQQIEEQYNEILDNCIDKDIILIISMQYYLDIKELDYIILLKLSDKEIKEVYNRYMVKWVSIEQFYEIKKIIQILCINCNATNINDLFYGVEFEEPE